MYVFFNVYYKIVDLHKIILKIFSNVRLLNFLQVPWLLFQNLPTINCSLKSSHVLKFTF